MILTRTQTLRSFTRYTIYLLVVVAGLLWGCVTDYTGDFPESERKPVLNALLAADSTFAMRLSWPVLQGDTADFQPIDNAVVKLWEGDQFLGEPQLTSSGQYQLNYLIKSGKSYSVQVVIPNADTLTATTVVPVAPVAQVSQYNIQNDILDADGYTLKVVKPEVNVNGCWLFVHELDDENHLIEQNTMLYSNSTLCDNFNRSLNSTADAVYSFSYDYYIRIAASMLSFDNNAIELASFLPMKHARFLLVSASTDYDQYFRTAHLQKAWSPSTDMPFTYQAITIHSNVTNGFGIFAGYTATAYYFHHTK